LAAGSEGTSAKVLELTTDAVDGHDLLALRQILVPTSGWQAPWPDRLLLQVHLDLLQHHDARVRREALEGFVLWLAGTPWDPLPRGAPIIVPLHVLGALAVDPDPGVRKRWIRLLRAASPALPDALVRDAVLTGLDDPHPGVRRAAVAALPDLVTAGRMGVQEAWNYALVRVGPDIPVGRAACDSLSRLHAQATAQNVKVDAETAMETILDHHPERGWRFAATWGASLPARESWMQVLLWNTLGYDASVVRRWAAQNPDALARTVADWPEGRYDERQFWAERDRRPRSPGDNLSAPSDPPADPPVPD
jgi:hypothetical protein